MKWSDVLLSVGLFVLSIIYFYHALALPQGMHGGVPRAGSFPMYLAVLLLISSGVYAVQATVAIRRAHVHGEEVETSRVAPHVLVMMASVVAYVGALELLGFVLATFAFTTLILRFYFDERWLRGIGAALLLTFATYAIFDYALSIPLPVGSILEQG